MHSTGVSPVVSGVPAAPMLTMSTVPSAFLTSQVQPEPKLPTAEVRKAVLKASSEPHLASMAAARAPVGAPPPFGFMQFQKKLWFQTWAALLYTPPAGAFFTMASRSRFSYSVPLIRLFRLVTYA